MQCRDCGSSLAANVAFCPACGASVAPQPAPASAAVPAKPGKSNLPQAGETFANRYRVEKYLGLGALCNSYLCRDLGSGNREVVLKVMHARKAAEPGLAESFLFLAESVAKYEHKGIAKIYASGRHEGAPYYTMEWVGGVPLRLWLMERLNFDNRVLPGLGIIVALLDTFEVIHERGCYGCVKPENVFITLNGPVITDFGVVGFLSPQEFEFNSYARRYLPYMAPELRQDWSNLLPHSDFYSLGAILYEILVGRAPAPQLRLPSELSRIFDIEADEIILKSMAARPLDRFATVEAFKGAVLSLQASLLHARPPEETAGLPESANPTLAPRAHHGLDITSDMQTLHNPNVAFSANDLPRSVVPPGVDIDVPEGIPDGRNPSRPVAGQGPVGGQGPGGKGPVPLENPWVRERAPESASGPGRDGVIAGKPDEDDSDDPAARTMFMPKSGGEENEQTLSAFARLGDKIVEEAHAQRRFAHAPGVPPGGAATDGASPEASGQPWEGTAEEAAFAEAEDPVPAWLWISIALAGSCMVVLSAYFGLLRN
jgi:serine/threonine protein kinase